MPSKNNFKNQAKKFFNRRTLTGPGKFGVFVVLCILIIFSFEYFGLINKESNLEIRIINRKVVLEEKKAKKAHSTNTSSIHLNNKLKNFNQIEYEKKKKVERELILFKGAINQQIYEYNLVIEKIESIKNSFGNKIYFNVTDTTFSKIFFDA